jgi:hypothetical protein
MTAAAQATWDKIVGRPGPSNASRNEAKRALNTAKAHSASAAQTLEEFIACDKRLVTAEAALASAEAALASVLNQVVTNDMVRDDIAAAASQVAATDVEAAEKAVREATLACDKAAARASEAQPARTGKLAVRRQIAAAARAAMAEKNTRERLRAAEKVLDTATKRQRTAGPDALDALDTETSFCDIRAVSVLLVSVLAALLSTAASSVDTRSARAALSDLRTLAAQLNPRYPMMGRQVRNNRCWYRLSTRDRRESYRLDVINYSFAVRAARVDGTNVEADGKLFPTSRS